MLIGVDHGNKQIKTVHCNPFVSGLKQSVTRPFGQNVLRYQNTYYTLSTERIPYRKDKTEDDRFFILTLFALAGEIEARGAYASEVQRIQLAVGLPPAHFGAQVERFTQYFGQRGMVEFEMQFEDGVFPVSAYYDELLTKLYGDYHALPNPEDRKCKEHVAILDLEHPYEAHLSELHNMQFDVLTRSIR